MPTTLSGSFISAMACRVPSTLAAPHMSNFISSISAPGLSEMPPVSKVMPLPTSTTGFAFLARAVVLQHDELRRLARCPARPRAASPCRASPCPCGRGSRRRACSCLPSAARLVGEVGRRADVAGQVAEILARAPCPRDGAAFDDRALGAERPACAANVQVMRFSGGRRALFALHLIEAVQRVGATSAAWRTFQALSRPGNGSSGSEHGASARRCRRARAPRVRTASR